MKKRQFTLLSVSMVTFLLPLLLVLPACEKNLDKQAATVQDDQDMRLAEKHGVKAIKHFTEVNLVANNNEYGAAHLDPVLQNAWGLAFSTTGIAWVAAQAGHVSTVYDAEGTQLRPAVNIPSATSNMGGSPTGVVFNTGNANFLLPAPNNQPARFIFVGDDGIVSAWNQAAGNNAMRIADNSATAAYTGLSIATKNNNRYLYAANFKSGKIDVWDQNFNPVAMSFTDPQLPQGYAPFNIKNIESRLYVMYAKKGADGEEEKGMGNGIVDIYTPGGLFVKRFITGGQLNAPWGIAKAPASFMKHNGNDDQHADEDKGANNDKSVILVGNFGDGHINAYRTDGTLKGELWDNKSAIEIEGLWALSFAPPGATSVSQDRLYFTAGPDDEEHGLFGYIKRK